MSQESSKKPKSAVSLRYDAGRDAAPVVTAKGQGLIAERIIELARANNIPIKEDPDLVQVLSQVNLNQEIPPAIYQVVAELLAFIYKMNQEYKPPST
ncbi:EscU/YscU/HrcU family type III secretion system export apparatus switch protein [Nitrospina gracilis]|uniref:EscU/YscU/HrcU family type III secretion system export apparatus switch protein n=1 Tax=Nitrospina gracilis TaxID=35801 RepID=UPI001F2DC3EE|nr:EscU/YscU/HrcU family type III secretion system export apparatus switch protein [Nitrospina gracilis]MCF8720613.1 flagellar biosynthesis protein [Nitrospina gracilis Nb-211]